MGTVERPPSPADDHSKDTPTLARKAKDKLGRAIERVKGKRSSSEMQTKLKAIADNAALSISQLTASVKMDHLTSVEKILKLLKARSEGEGTSALGAEIAKAAYDAASAVDSPTPDRVIQAAEEAAIECALRITSDDAGKENMQFIADAIKEELQDYKRVWDYDSAITRIVGKIINP